VAVKNVGLTALELYLDCPRAYAFERIERVPAHKPEPLLLGGVAHAAIAAYFQHCYGNGLSSDLERIPEICRVTWQTYPEQPLPHHAYDDYVGLVEAAARSYTLDAEHLGGIEDREPLAFERWTVWLVIDLWELHDDGLTAVIRDWKSDHHLWSQADAEQALQLQAYAWKLGIQYPQIQRFVCEYHFLRHGKVRRVEYDRSVLARFEEKLRAMIALREGAKDFPPRPGAHCQWCSYSEICPAFKVPGVVHIETPEDARHIGEEILVLEKRLKDRKEALKAFTAAHGKLAVNGIVFGHFLTESHTVEDLVTLGQVLAEAGRDPWELVRVDATKLKPLIRDPEIGPKLEPLLVDKSYSSFTSRKDKGGRDDA